MFLPKTLSNKILAFGLLFSLLQVAAAAGALYFAWASGTADLKAIRTESTQLEIEHINRLVFATVMDARGVYMEQDWSRAAKFAQGMAQSLDELESIATRLRRNDEIAQDPEFVKTLGKVTEFVAFRRRFIGIARNSLPEGRAFGDNDENRSNRKALNGLLDTLTKKYAALAHESVSAARAWRADVKMLQGLNLVTPVLILVIVAFLIIAHIKRPLLQIADSVQTLARGDLEARIFGEGRDDEIGAIAKSLVVFRDKLRAADEARAAAAAERERAERERLVATQTAISSERGLVSSSLGVALEKLATKSLAYRLAEELPQDYAALQANFNAAMADLQVAMRDVVEGANSVATGSDELASASVDLSRRTEQQAANLEEMSAALAEMSEKIEETAAGAREARTTISTASADAEAGGRVVRETIEAIKKIEASSNQIRGIVGLIDEIAFQTNLLALNAGVEAARAGDAGRGFAVVASEVRTLATKSADAAKEIGALIARAASDVTAGAALAQQSGDAFGKIFTRIQETHGVVAQIAERSEEQANGLREMNLAMRQLDEMTQQNAAMAEESTAASQSLSTESQRLLELMAQFSIDDPAQSDRVQERPRFDYDARTAA